MSISRRNRAPARPAAVPALVGALADNKEVTVRVEGVARYLSHLTDDFRDKTAGPAPEVDAKAVLKASAKVELMVNECADDLQLVNKVLAEEVTALERSEAALARSQAALADTECALAAAQEAERDARVEARHDSATGLPNREHFDSRLSHDIALAARHGLGLAVMFFDLNKFKHINDTHGHAAGDEVLRQIAARLLEQCRTEDTVCRAGGDEFLYLLIDPKGRRNVERIAAALVERITQPVSFGDASVDVECSVGIALYPEHGATADQLVRNADAAMYAAKTKRSGASWMVYEPLAPAVAA